MIHVGECTSVSQRVSGASINKSPTSRCSQARVRVHYDGGQLLSDAQVLESARPAQLRWHKKLLFVVIGVVSLGFVLLCFGELGLRVLSLFPTSFRSSPFRQYDPVLGLSLIPNKHVIHARGCFQGEVSTNRWGMRDRNRSLEKGPHEFRIALVGDSVVEGVQVKSDEVMNIRMEKLLAEKGYPNTEVLNFSVEGIGTDQELVMYQERVRRFHPDVVVLVFVENDVMNNSSTLQPKAYGIHTWYAPYYDLGANGDLVFRPVEPRLLDGWMSFLESHFLLTYYLERIWFQVYIPLYTWHGVSLMWGAFGDPPEPEWQQAWLITAKAMTLFKDTVLNDGAKFLVVVAANFYQIDPDWRQRFIQREGKIPLPFSVNKFEERLREVAERNHIPMEFLAPYFVAYRDAHHLQWPYFSLSCDPHYSALGHEVAAEAMVQKLEEGHFLPPPAGQNR